MLAGLMQCPFCPGVMSINRLSRGGTSLYYQPICNQCEARGPKSLTEPDTMDKAIEMFMRQTGCRDVSITKEFIDISEQLLRYKLTTLQTLEAVVEFAQAFCPDKVIPESITTMIPVLKSELEPLGLIK